MRYYNGEILVGVFYSEADDNRDTCVEYADRNFVIHENYWENDPDEWSVTLDHNMLDHSLGQDNIWSVEELYQRQALTLAAIRILQRLDYEYDSMIKDNLSLWNKCV